MIKYNLEQILCTEKAICLTNIQKQHRITLC